jgi:hypothetical protein
MSTLKQTITLNTDLFPLSAAINNSYTHTTTIDGNATIFGTIALDPTAGPLPIEMIELNNIDARAVVFLQANASNQNDRVNVGLYDAAGPSFEVIMQLAAGEIAIFPYKFIPDSLSTSKLACQLDGVPTGVTDRHLNFAILENA